VLALASFVFSSFFWDCCVVFPSGGSILYRLLDILI
jgi:hypothetical protein